MQAINKLILGTVQFGLNYGVNNTSGKPDQETVQKILSFAYDAGIRYLDTAEAYGDAHDVIGLFHEKNPTQVFDIITKLPHQIDENISTKVENYLEQLHVKQLYGLLFHSYQSYADNKESIQLLNKYKSAGKVKYIGVSVYTNTQMDEVINDDNIDIIQLPFNLFDNENLRGEILEKAKRQNKIIHSRSAFLQGLFFSTPEKKNKTAQALSEELNYINQISNRSKISVQKIALNYCLQQAHIDSVLIGVDNLSQLNQNVADADLSLSDMLINEINSIHIKDTDLLNPSLWTQ